MGLGGIVDTLRSAAADPETRGTLVAVVDGGGSIDLRIPPPELTTGAILAAIRRAEPTAAGLVLPVRTVWGEDQPCAYLDAEALVLVAAEEVGDGVVSVGGRCALHELPDGWCDVHDELQWLARPLRDVVASAATPD